MSVPTSDLFTLVELLRQHNQQQDDILKAFIGQLQSQTPPETQVDDDSEPEGMTILQRRIIENRMGPIVPKGSDPDTPIAPKSESRGSEPETPIAVKTELIDLTEETPDLERHPMHDTNAASTPERTYLTPNRRKFRIVWEDEEKEEFEQIMIANPNMNWRVVARQFPGKTPEQCSVLYKNLTAKYRTEAKSRGEPWPPANSIARSANYDSGDEVRR
jgi:hypothetical protein